jgi:hypothetical protein
VDEGERTRRRKTRREPGLEVIEGHEVWVLQVEEPLGGDASAICEFVSIDGARPIRRALWLVADHLLPTTDIDAARLDAVNLTRLGERAREQLRGFVANHPDWAEAARALQDSGIPDRTGRPRRTDQYMQRFTDAYRQAGLSRPHKVGIYEHMRWLLDFKSEDSSQIERDIAYLRQQIRDCRKRGLLPKGRPGRPGTPSQPV